MSQSITLDRIAELTSGEVVGDGSITISGFSSAEGAHPGDLTFADTETFFKNAEQSQASAILVSGKFNPGLKPFIRVGNARIAAARLLPLFFPPDTYVAGVDATAVVHPTAQIDPSAHVGPYTHVGSGARIGARTVLEGGNHVGKDSVIGEDARLAPNVVLYSRTKIGNRVIIHAGTVIGSDGYGYVFDQGKHRKVLQVGNVVVQDDVEIGANAAIDRGAFGSTMIGRGTKIDNLVHIAHNVVMGSNCLVLGQAGFAGSTKLEDYCVVASQSGIAGHLTLGRESVVGAKSGVMRDVPAKGRVLGIPAMPDIQMKRQWVSIKQIPDINKRLREMEVEVAALKAAIAAS